MPILNTGQIFSSGDQVTSQKLMDIADLATFDDPADGSTIIVNSQTYGISGGDGKLKVPSGGITSNELASDSVTATKIVDGAVTSAKLNSDAISALMPTGTVLPFAGINAPTGYLFCDGDAISRSTYSDLFDIIDETYGAGDGSTTFNIPDLRGRVIAGQDDMGGTSADRLTGQSGGVNGDNLGATGGAETHTLTTSEMPSHTHTYSESSSGPAARGVGDSTTAVARQNVNSGSTGGDQPHNNVQPTIILNYIIKT
jgi:microcystin-dependent protein